MHKNFLYFVEGETEEKLLKTLKTDFQYIYPGIVRRFNVIQNIIKPNMLLSYPSKISLVFIFDTDRNDCNVLKRNIDIVSKLPNKPRLFCIPQVKNLEDELSYSCGIKDIRKITGSKSLSDFKRDFLKIGNLFQRLTYNNFDIKKFWSRSAQGVFADIENDSAYVKNTVIISSQT